MNVVPEEFTHPSWATAAATVASYGLVLLAMFALLFLAPYILFFAL